MSRKLNRPVTPAWSSSPITAASASSGLAPSRSRFRVSAHSSAESTRASRLSSSSGLSVAASPAPVPGHPVSVPLWLNSQWSAPNGDAADALGSVPALASRTAASSAPLRVTRVRSANDGSAQIGPEFR